MTQHSRTLAALGGWGAGFDSQHPHGRSQLSVTLLASVSTRHAHGVGIHAD